MINTTFSIINWTFQSAFANLVVVGVVSGSLITNAGVLIMPVSYNRAKILIINGMVLMTTIVLLSMALFGHVPTTFQDIRDLGLWTIGNGMFTTWFDLVTDYFISISIMIGGFLIPIGIILTILRTDWGPKAVIIGALMLFLGGMLGNGRLIEIIFHWASMLRLSLS
ncbi:MAG: hypothetical protein ACTSWN_06060 [Promethearchaeota archaeon]